MIFGNSQRSVYTESVRTDHVNGDTVDLIVDGVEVMKVITREEFNAGIKRLAQENNTVPADAQTPAEPLDGAMNPPEQHVRGQRRRRTRS